MHSGAASRTRAASVPRRLGGNDGGDRRSSAADDGIFAGGAAAAAARTRSLPAIPAPQAGPESATRGEIPVIDLEAEDAAGEGENRDWQPAAFNGAFSRRPRTRLQLGTAERHSYSSYFFRKSLSDNVEVGSGGGELSGSPRSRLQSGKIDRRSYSSDFFRIGVADNVEVEGGASPSEAGSEGLESARDKPRTRLHLGEIDRPSYRSCFFTRGLEDDAKDVDVVVDAEEEDEESGGSEDETDGEEARAEEGDSSGVALKRRRFSGINVDNERFVGIGRVADRTRSRFHSELSKKKLGTICNPSELSKMKLGTIHRPYLIDGDESGSDSSYSDMSDGEDEEDGADDNADELDDNGGEEEAVQELNKEKRTERKRVKCAKVCSDMSMKDGCVRNIDRVNVNGGEKKATQEELSKGKSSKRKPVKSPKAYSDLSMEDGCVRNVDRVNFNVGVKEATLEELSKGKSNKRKQVKSPLAYSDLSMEDRWVRNVDNVNVNGGEKEAAQELSKGKSKKRRPVKSPKAYTDLSMEDGCVRKVDRVNVNGGENKATQELSKGKSKKRRPVKRPKSYSDLSMEDGCLRNINRVNADGGEKEAPLEDLSKGKSNKRKPLKSPKAYSDLSMEDECIHNVDKVNANGGEKEAAQEELMRGKSNKRKRVKALKADTLFKVLIDTILNNSKNLPEGLSKPHEKEEVPSSSAELLPLVFSFKDDESMPAVRTEQEMELDQLWAECDFAMESEKIGSYHTNMGQTEEINEPGVEADPAILCSRGAHQLILNEQIGYICKFCSTVVQEIKDILPCWNTLSERTSARRSSFLEDCSSILDDVYTTKSTSQRSSVLLDGTVWNLIPGVERDLYQHQRDAFEFIWKNLAGSIQLDQLKTCAKSDGVGGCVISHPPGTGKTRLAIIFIQTYVKAFPECRPVIVAPSGILLTWEKELKKWDANLPLHNMNVSEYSGSEDVGVCEIVQKEPKSCNWSRIVKLYSWAKGSGILGLSYELFKRLTGEDTNSNLRSASMGKILLERAGLLVLDEGHTPRNDHTLIWKALEKVQTKQRIILSGTPFQNNFFELHNTLRLVRPKFVESKGKLTSRTNCISDDSLEELRSLIKPFVHVYNGKILDKLPGLRDCLIYLEPGPQQKMLLDKMNVKKKDDLNLGGALEIDYKVSLASVHPSLVTTITLSAREESLYNKRFLEKLTLDPNEGVKTRFVMEVVRLSEVLKEKVVIFSQFHQPILMIKKQLIKHFSWTEGIEVLQMDGKKAPKHRQPSIDIFNDSSSNAKVLLASTKACCEGICLTGASRVVLLDIVWNPSAERQAISRAYRIGQDKIVYVYHLITSGTSEEEKYEKQIQKTHMSKLVFSPDINMKNIKSQPCHTEDGQLSRLVSEDKILEEMVAHDKLKDMFAKIYYRPKESNFTNVLY